MSLTSREERVIIIEYLSLVFLIILLGSLLSFSISFVWEGSEFYLTWGRELIFIPLSLGEFTTYSLFRPSGIYDEPGALALFVSIICVAREIYGLKRRLTLLIACLALVTMSPIPLLFLVLFSITQTKILFLCTFCFFNLVILADLIPFGGLLYEGLFSRILRIDEFVISLFYQNNRVEAFYYALEIFLQQSTESLIIGQPPRCLIENICDFTKPDFTLLSPVINQGLLNSWYYYIGLAIILFMSFTCRKNLLLLVVFINFIIRPSAHSQGYAAWFALILTIVIFDMISTGKRDDRKLHHKNSKFFASKDIKKNSRKYVG